MTPLTLKDNLSYEVDSIMHPLKCTTGPENTMALKMMTIHQLVRVNEQVMKSHKEGMKLRKELHTYFYEHNKLNTQGQATQGMKQWLKVSPLGNGRQ